MKSEVQIHLKDCPDRCPGCKHRSLTSAESENLKLEWLKTKLSSWAKVLEPVRGVRDSLRTHYRKKVCLHAQWEHDHWRFGLRVRKEKSISFSDTEVIHIPRCPNHALLIQKVVEDLSKKLPSSEVFPLVYLSISGTLLTLVVKLSKLDSQLIDSLKCDYDWKSMGLEGVWLNLNPSAGNRVFSSRGWVFIWGQARAQSDGFIYGPDSFQQLIPELHQDSLRETQQFLLSTDTSQTFKNLDSEKKSLAIMDLYSGVGRSLKVWQSLGIPSIGVELSGDAFQCLQENLQEGTPLRGRVSERIPQLEEWRIVHSHLDLCVYVNPPRLGLELEVAHWLAYRARPIRLVYLSCSAGTLQRDLQIFTQAGYQMRRIIPYDFFPRTIHIETLVFLDRKA